MKNSRNTRFAPVVLTPIRRDDLALIGNGYSRQEIREQKVLPTHGIVHDIGRAITHKRIIIRLYLQGLLVPEIVRRTDHSEEVMCRYIKAFEKVRMVRDRLDEKGVLLER
jgi:hypothetical protein